MLRRSLKNDWLIYSIDEWALRNRPSEISSSSGVNIAESGSLRPDTTEATTSTVVFESGGRKSILEIATLTIRSDDGTGWELRAALLIKVPKDCSSVTIEELLIGLGARRLGEGLDDLESKKTRRKVAK